MPGIALAAVLLVTASPGMARGQAHDPIDDFPTQDDMIRYLVEVAAVVGTLATAWVVLRVCGYFARPDPAKYILSDPWVQSQLARNGAATGPGVAGKDRVTDPPGGAVTRDVPPAPR